MSKGILKRRPILFFNFLSAKGVFAQEVPKGTPGAEERENKEGRIVHEVYVNYLAGKLVAIKRNEQDKYGVRFELGLYDEIENQTYIITLGYEGYNTRATLNRLAGLTSEQLSQDFVFYITQSPDKENPGKKNSWLKVAVTDDLDGALSGGFNALYDLQLKERFEKNVLPPVGERYQNGKKFADYTKQTEYLWAAVETDVIPDLKRPSAFDAMSRQIDEASAEELPPAEEVHPGVPETHIGEDEPSAIFDKF
jgi:hypothetical protein